MGHTTFASRFARAVIALAVLAGAFASQAAPAAGWANGGGDGYGTHDWIIDQAMRVLDGRVDGWFDAQTARIHSDDPDTIERAAGDQDDHVYHEKGKRGGAIDRIATEFDKAQASYAAGDYEDASYHIGLLSHIYGDILQPYHTAYAAMNRDTEHHNYEQVVAPLTRKASDMPAWQSSRRTVSTFGNIRTKAVASAKYSRSLYPALHKAFAPDQHHMNATVKAITGKVMKRAADDLADVIWSIAQGTGAQPQVGSLKVSVRWVGVSRVSDPVGLRDREGRQRQADRGPQGRRGVADHQRDPPGGPVHRPDTGSRCARAPSGPHPSSRSSTWSPRPPCAASSGRPTRGGRSRPSSRPAAPASRHGSATRPSCPVRRSSSRRPPTMATAVRSRTCSSVGSGTSTARR